MSRIGRSPRAAAQRHQHGVGPRIRAALRRVWERPAGRFLVRYPIVVALMFALPAVVPAIDRWLIHATVQSLATARILLPVHVNEPAFAIGSTTIQIVSDCTPMFPMLLLIGGMLAFPAPWRAKVVGSLVGAVVLWLYNLLRIFVLMAVLRFAPAQFDIVHVFLWQSLTLLMVLGCFLLWIHTSGPREARA
jgi:exosortase/archaeosortase family protein